MFAGFKCMDYKEYLYFLEKKPLHFREGKNVKTPKMVLEGAKLG